MRKTSDALEILDRMTGDDPGLHQLIEDEALNLQVAELIYEARTAAGLTQKQLAELIGTRQSAIARLEDADYGGHSLNILKRVAHALGYRVKLDFEKISGRKTKRARSGEKTAAAVLQHA